MLHVSVLKTLAAICLTMSLISCKSSQEKPAPPSDVAICPSTAFIEVTEYEIPGLTSKSDKAFHEWVATGYAPKYPVLKNAYADLLECWNHYHPKTETK